jgi:hypothetical protein
MLEGVLLVTGVSRRLRHCMYSSVTLRGFSASLLNLEIVLQRNTISVSDELFFLPK